MAAGPDDVAEYRPRLHRGQLLMVSHEHQAGVAADGLEQAGHQRQRHHGRLVDHDDVMGKLVVLVVPETVATGGVAPEQAMDGRRLQGQEPLAGADAHF